MAPEAFRGKASAASDVYSLTVSLFYLLTGDLPFPCETWDGLMARIAEGLSADDPRMKTPSGQLAGLASVGPGRRAGKADCPG